MATITVQQATVGSDSPTKGTVSLTLDEVRIAVADYLHAKHGLEVFPEDVTFDHISDYDCREFSGASANITVKIAQA